MKIIFSYIFRLEGDVFPTMFGKGPEKQMLEEMAHSVSFKL